MAFNGYRVRDLPNGLNDEDAWQCLNVFIEHELWNVNRQHISVVAGLPDDVPAVEDAPDRVLRDAAQRAVARFNREFNRPMAGSR